MNNSIIRQMFDLQDEAYKQFQCKLMPTIDANTVIGIRTPQLRKLANNLVGSEAASEFISTLPHQYYEENNLHGFLIEKIKDYDECVAALNQFLPYVDNWSTCDMMSPKAFKKHPPQLIEQIKLWLSSDHTYTVRFGIKLLMSLYLDEYFQPEYLELTAGICSDEYYIKMMIAWYFATALAKQYDAALPYITQRRLDKWTHNKTIQKSIESYRITDQQKIYLKSLKIK